MLFRELRNRYPKNKIFLDVDSRDPGLSFPDKVRAALDDTDALLVVIGPQWLEILRARTDENTRDWVQYEVSEGLKRHGLPVVPVCHVHARLPSFKDLPTAIRDLAVRDGIIMDPFQDFDSHLSRLLSDLERVIKRKSGVKLRPTLSSDTSTDTHGQADTTTITKASELANKGKVGNVSINSVVQNSALVNSTVEENRPSSRSRPRKGSVSGTVKLGQESGDLVQKHGRLSDEIKADSRSKPSTVVRATSPSKSNDRAGAYINGFETADNHEDDDLSPVCFVKLDHVFADYQLGAAEPVLAINDVTLGITQGVFLVVSGPSGSGKTTLLKLIGGMKRPARGTVHIDGVDIYKDLSPQGVFAKIFPTLSRDELTHFRKRAIGFVPESLDLLLDKTVAENVLQPLLERDDIGRSERQDRLVSVVSMVGLNEKMGEAVGRISKIEQFCVGLARALAGSPRILLLDDPTAALDQSGTMKLVRLLKAINVRLGLTIICSTRKEQKILDTANRIVKLENGAITTLGIRETTGSWALARVRNPNEFDDPE